MRKVLVGVAATLVLTGCINSKEKKMEGVCKEIVLNHAIDPKGISFNEISLFSGEMERDDFVRDYYGSEAEMGDAAKIVLRNRFDAGGEGATQHLVDIDYTDKSRGQARATREQAICIYIGYGKSVELNSFFVKNQEVNKSKLLEYFMFNKKPKGLSLFGKIE